MPTLVEKLQLDAMDPNVRVTDLLRRVKFTAVQLGLGKVEDWVEQELNGYHGPTPDYRTVFGRPMSHHPYRGWEDTCCAMVCNAYGSVSIGDEVGNAVIFLQRTPLFTPQDHFHRCTESGFGDLGIF